MWQVLRNELHPKGFELVSVGLDTLGGAGCREFIEAASRFALAPAVVVARSRPRDPAVALGHAHFQLATQLEIDGHHDAAVPHFREAHRLVPASWTFRRQAWSLEKTVAGPLARFWQGPDPDAPAAWPYAGDWLSDVRRVGADNYSEPWWP